MFRTCASAGRTRKCVRWRHAEQARRVNGCSPTHAKKPKGREGKAVVHEDRLYVMWAQIRGNLSFAARKPLGALKLHCCLVASSPDGRLP